MDAYQDAIARTWARLAEDADMHELLRYATLAANSHNTQPWRFRLSGNAVAILPDLSRRTPMADPDDHHLFATLGCSAENLSLAGAARGRHASVTFDEAGDGAVSLIFEDGKPTGTDLFDAIPVRQSTRSDFDGRPVSSDELAALEASAQMPGVELLMIADRPKVEQVLEYVIAANTAQMENADFVRELKHWLRFNAVQALATSDGLYSAASGNPSLPGWLASLIFGFVFTTGGENERYARQIRSSSGIAIFSSAGNNKAAWVDAGRALQRFLLKATALGLKTAFVNQPVEVADVRSQFADWLELKGRRPDFVVRFGHADPLPKSLRRPVEAVVT